MKDVPKFIGRMYTEDEKSILNQIIQDEAAKGVEKIEGELEKTDEELETIHFANVIMDVWLKSRNIAFEQVIPERVHLFPTIKFHEHDTDPSTLGFYRISDDAIFIDHDKASSRAKLLSILVHEFLHRTHDTSASHKLSASEEGEIFSARSGYRMTSAWKNKSARFVGLNEIVLVYCQFQILNEAGAFLENTANISPSELLKSANYHYMQYADLLDAIVKGISTGEVDSQKEVYDKLVQGQFSNTMLVLKDIDRAFGKNSLRILSYLGAFDGEPRTQIDSLVKEYFFEKNAEARKNLATHFFDREKNFTEVEKET